MMCSSFCFSFFLFTYGPSLCGSDKDAIYLLLVSQKSNTIVRTVMIRMVYLQD